MYRGCTALVSAPALPAVTLADYCYEAMFSNCSALTSAPELPASALAGSCYRAMFSGCTTLTAMPELPATTLTDHCYYDMFQGCTALTNTSDLAAMALADYCYGSMFNGCTSLVVPPALPATTLAAHCYQNMFKASGLKVALAADDIYTDPWRIPSTGSASTSANAWNSGMLSDTLGSFSGDPALNTTYYLDTLANQPLPGFEGTLPTVRGSVAAIIPTGSLADAGYEVASSDPEVALTVDNEDGSYTVKVVGKVGDSYVISVTAKGNSEYSASPTYRSAPQTVRDPSAGPTPDQALKISLPQKTYYYTGKAIKPVPVVSYKGQVLAKGRQYQFEANYKHNKELGKNIARATFRVVSSVSGSPALSTQTLKFSIGLAAPQIKKVKKTKKALKVTLKSKVKGAKKYVLYYSKHKNSGFKHKTLKLGHKKTLTLKKKLGKKKCYVKVKAYAPKAYKKLTKAKTYKASKAKKLALKWSKSPYATKYRIAYKVKGTHKWHYKSVKASKASYSLKRLKKNKKYSVKLYYKSKAFKSAYSKVKA
jgi:hypothetical protein